MPSSMSKNGKKITCGRPSVMTSIELYHKSAAYSPKSYSVFDGDISRPHGTDENSEIFAWVDDTTLYLQGSVVSVESGMLRISTSKANVDGSVLYLTR